MTTPEAHGRCSVATLASLLLLATPGTPAQQTDAAAPEMTDGRSDRAGQPLSPAAVAADLAEAVTSPAGDASSGIELAAPPASPRAQRLVYACHDGAIAMFSDRPCGDSVQLRALPVREPAAGQTSSTLHPAPVASTRPVPKPAPRRAEHAPPDRCTRLETQLATIDDRMRQGYSAREAARLWERWRVAKARLRDAGC